MVIESSTLANRLAAAVDNAFPSLAYRLTLGEDGEIRWLGTDGKIYLEDPGSSWWERALVEIGSWLPIEWLL